jgi:hypothetical protein
MRASFLSSSGEERARVRSRICDGLVLVERASEEESLTLILSLSKGKRQNETYRR